MLPFRAAAKPDTSCPFHGEHKWSAQGASDYLCSKIPASTPGTWSGRVGSNGGKTFQVPYSNADPL